MTFREINFHPGDRELRVFSLAWLVTFGLVGSLLAWRAGAFSSGAPLSWQQPWRAALAFWCVAVAGGALGLTAPRAMRPAYIALTVAAFPIGWTVSMVLLAAVYFVVFTAFGLVFRALGRDPLGRSFDRDARSYWAVRRPVADLHRYFRQF